MRLLKLELFRTFFAQLEAILLGAHQPLGTKSGPSANNTIAHDILNSIHITPSWQVHYYFSFIELLITVKGFNYLYRI